MRIFLEWFYYNSTLHELQWKGDIECYDEVMGQYPNYLRIWWYNLVLRFKQFKDYFTR